MTITATPVKRAKLLVHYQDLKGWGKYIYLMVIFNAVVNTEPGMVLIGLMYIM